jgi:hypothetical protein
MTPRGHALVAGLLFCLAGCAGNGGPVVQGALPEISGPSECRIEVQQVGALAPQSINTVLEAAFPGCRQVQPEAANYAVEISWIRRAGAVDVLLSGAQAQTDPRTGSRRPGLTYELGLFVSDRQRKDLGAIRVTQHVTRDNGSSAEQRQLSRMTQALAQVRQQGGRPPHKP